MWIRHILFRFCGREFLLTSYSHIDPIVVPGSTGSLLEGSRVTADGESISTYSNFIF